MEESVQKKAIRKLINEINEGKIVIKDEYRFYRKYKNGSKFTEHLNAYGYYRIFINIEGKQVFVLSHRLLFAYYHGIERLDFNKTINHIDHNKTNNSKDNLEQITREENSSEGALYHSGKLNEPNQIVISDGLYFKNNLSKSIILSGYKRKYLCKVLNVTEQTLSKWCNGVTHPTIDKVFILCELLKCNIDELYDRNGEED